VAAARFLEVLRRHPTALAAGAAAWLGLVAYAGARLGDGVLLLVAHLVPVALLAWCASFAAAAVAALIGAVATLVFSLAIRSEGSPGVSAWNVATLAVVGGAIAGTLALLRVQGDRVRALLESEIRLSREDPLTGLASSRAFYERFSHEIERMKRHGRPLALLYLDLDNFKQVNDEHGHRAGDQVLEAVGQVLRGHVRRVDLAARIGGDEFVVLMPETEPEDAAGVSRRVRDAIVRRFRDAGPRIGVSAGLGTFAHPPTDPELTIHLVDQLMYEAKRSGKDRIVDRVFA
jgi:diguanylate cyclase (GGDEF)-like protein